MIRSYKVDLNTNEVVNIVEEKEDVTVRLSFKGLTRTVYVGDSSVTPENGFPLKNEVKYYVWEFIVRPGDKFCAVTDNVTTIVLNILVMSLASAPAVARTGSESKSKPEQRPEERKPSFLPKSMREGEPNASSRNRDSDSHR